jgi:N-acetyl-gamma-glutamylphosphate reductase
MKVAITGATGFVGAFVLRALLEQPQHQIAVLGRHREAAWRIQDCIDRVHWIDANLDQPEVQTVTCRFNSRACKVLWLCLRNPLPVVASIGLAWALKQNMALVVTKLAKRKQRSPLLCMAKQNWLHADSLLYVVSRQISDLHG